MTPNVILLLGINRLYSATLVFIVCFVSCYKNVINQGCGNGWRARIPLGLQKVHIDLAEIRTGGWESGNMASVPISDTDFDTDTI